MNVIRKFFPYGMDKQEDGTWVFFNRDYKPVGMTGDQWLNYTDYPSRVTLKKLGPATREKLSIHGNGHADDNNRIYFYDDGTAPLLSEKDMNAYMRKLEILMRLEIQ